MRKVTLKLNAYNLIGEAVERGISWGVQHAHKHTDTPSEEYLKQQLEHDIMLELSEVIDFDRSG